ncbi:MAG: helix-turn-helix domain-containing protein [Oscillospiraceae bacterium]|nr:helix-turn-helix domain-containing protein [Oscillospiraceae bacterium]
MDNRFPVPDEIPVITETQIFRPGENVYVQFPPQYSDFIGVIHKHTFIEIVYIVSGSATHIVNNREVAASKGDLFIINYDTPHAFFPNEDDEPFLAYDLMFTPAFLDASLLNSVRLESIHSSFLFYSLFPSQQMGPDAHISGSSYNEFGELFGKIHLEFINRENGYVDILRAYVVELIIKIFRKMNTDVPSDQASRQSQIVEQALTYLKSNYQKHLSLDDFAAQVFLSKDYFSRLFRETTGVPISTYLKKVRIEEACKLLVNTDYTVDHIAELCGFSDTKNFYLNFKKHTGLTPKQYKQSSLSGTRISGASKISTKEGSHK